MIKIRRGPRTADGIAVEAAGRADSGIRGSRIVINAAGIPFQRGRQRYREFARHLTSPRTLD